MKLIIDVQEKDYQFLKEGYSYLKIKEHLTDTLDHRCYIAIANGTPLPKGHGRLIDADVLADGFEDNYEFCEEVNATPTIIEADKGE